MRDDHEAVDVAAILADVVSAESLMDLATAAPADDLDRRVPGDIAGQILVRQHDHARRAQRLDNADSVSGSTADIRLCLHLGGSVHIGDDGDVRVGVAEPADVGAGEDRKSTRLNYSH